MTVPNPHDSDGLSREAQTGDSEFSSEDLPARVESSEEHVTIRRTVRYVRLMVTGGVVGVVIGCTVTLLFPVGEDYTLAQILGFTALLSGTIGFAVGALIALILARVVRKSEGEATVMRVITHTAPSEETATAPAVSFPDSSGPSSTVPETPSNPSTGPTTPPVD
ncbi:hypothetical protein [Lysinibacter sp. HNR]|uniref:hypothetical protein n=1 Tax=Lysinibacter sp. HNR TaxID=3031408 RepID=UPI0024350E13|nr:hypothetical protein [Lysinibacter sp. HNR]WGD37728.1 hypothetical protein FrondiHNR_02100 [Lysinibacter sp. HNR]